MRNVDLSWFEVMALTEDATYGNGSQGAAYGNSEKCAAHGNGNKVATHGKSSTACDREE